MNKVRLVRAAGLVVTLGLLFGVVQQSLAGADKDKTVTLQVTGMI